LKFDPLQFKPENPLAFKLIQTKEINNGRLAMLAIAGIVAQELVTGEKIF
jgi:Chlorophyll A-B binding protein